MPKTLCADGKKKLSYKFFKQAINFKKEDFEIITFRNEKSTYIFTSINFVCLNEY